MRVNLMHNPGAGDEEHSGERLRRTLAEAGHRVRYVDMSDGATWRTVLTDDADLVVAAGGDGTVGQVAIAMADRDVPLAILPLGSLNNIARALGAHDDVAAAARTWPDAPRRALTIGSVRCGDRRRPFVESVGGGLLGTLLARAEADADDPSGPRRRPHGLGLLEDILGQAPAERWGVTVDGVDRSGAYLAVEALNIASIGPDLPLAPATDPADAHLQLVLVRDGDRAALSGALRRRRHDPEAPLPRLERHAARVVRLRPPAGVALHVDDTPSPFPATADGLEVRLDARVTVVVPASG